MFDDGDRRIRPRGDNCARMNRILSMIAYVVAALIFYTALPHIDDPTNWSLRIIAGFLVMIWAEVQKKRRP